MQESDSAYAQTRGGKSFWDTFLARDEKSWAVLGRTAAGAFPMKVCAAGGAKKVASSL